MTLPPGTVVTQHCFCHQPSRGRVNYKHPTTISHIQMPAQHSRYLFGALGEFG